MPFLPKTSAVPEQGYKSEDHAATASEEAERSAAQNADVAASAKMASSNNVNSEGNANSSSTVDDLQQRAEVKRERAWVETLRKEEANLRLRARASRNPWEVERQAPTGLLSSFERSLWAAFVLADRDGSGALSPYEFTQALKATGVIEEEVQARKEWIAADLDKSGGIEWPEFAKLGNRCKELATFIDYVAGRKEEVERAANLIQRHSARRMRTRAEDDRRGGGGGCGRSQGSGEGGLQKEQVPSGARVSERAWELALLAEEADENGRNSARATEREAPVGLSGFEKALWAAFVLADRDGSGALSRYEFTLALKAAGVIEEDVEARKEWKAADQDESGAIEWPEFCVLGKRRKELATLVERLRARPEADRAARHIQQSSRARAARVHDGQIRPTLGTSRV